MRSQPAATIAAFRLIIALGPAGKSGKDFEHFSWSVLLRPTIINGHVNSGRRRRNRISRIRGINGTRYKARRSEDPRGIKVCGCQAD